MKKKLYIILLCLILALACAVGLGIGISNLFDENSNNNEHSSHDWSSVYIEDGDRHYQTCSGCGEKKYGEHIYNQNGSCICGKVKSDEGEENPPAPPAHTGHTYNKKAVDSKYLKHAATCEHKAEYYYSCECGEKGTQTFEYGELLQHTPKAAARENVEDSTCTQEGSYDEVVRCDVCDTIISSTPKVIEKKQHTPKVAARENVEDSTCTNEGHYDEVIRCEVCDGIIVQRLKR